MSNPVLRPSARPTTVADCETKKKPRAFCKAQSCAFSSLKLPFPELTPQMACLFCRPNDPESIDSTQLLPRCHWYDSYSPQQIDKKYVPKLLDTGEASRNVHAVQSYEGRAPQLIAER